MPPADPPVEFRRLLRGARPTPRHKLLSARPFEPIAAPPAQYAVIPPRLDMWGNDQYGDCVSAEEAFAKACHSPEIFLDAATVVAWAAAGGFRDGANLTDVMDAMAKGGFVAGPQTYDDGPYAGVDYSNESVLQAAIAQGPVKIAIDANALPAGAGNQQGWYATGQGSFPNTDHCVSLCGYGPTAWLYQQLGVPMPAGLPASGYLLYTWSTIGFVDHAWLMGTCTEAWVRQPTTVGVPPLPGPNPPPPPAPPGPTPTPPVGGNVLTLATALPAGSYAIGGAGGLSPAQQQELTQALAAIQAALGGAGHGPWVRAPRPVSVNWPAVLAVVVKYLPSLVPFVQELLAALAGQGAA